MMIALAGLLSLLLAMCVYIIVKDRRNMARLNDQIEAFLRGEIPSPALSVKDDHFSMLENAVIELETRLRLCEDGARDQSERSQAFVQDVSHQFKTPIAGLRLFCEVDASEHRAQKLQLIERMEALLSALLTLEKLRSDGYSFEYTLLDLREVALDVRAQFMPMFPEKRITICGSATMRMDAHWMFEALINIIKNACEHTQADGHVNISIEQTAGEVIIRVEDDGGGVPPEALGRLFERFYRSGGARNASGVGLGLAIAKTITLKHHGSIRAENGEQGLKITLYFPILHTDLKKT